MLTTGRNILHKSERREYTGRNRSSCRRILFGCLRDARVVVKEWTMETMAKNVVLGFVSAKGVRHCSRWSSCHETMVRYFALYILGSMIYAHVWNFCFNVGEAITNRESSVPVCSPKLSPVGRGWYLYSNFYWSSLLTSPDKSQSSETEECFPESLCCWRFLSIVCATFLVPFSARQIRDTDHSLKFGPNFLIACFK